MKFTHPLTAYEIDQFNRHRGIACNRVYDRFYPIIYYYAKQMVNDNEEAEDIAQVSLTKLCISSEVFAGEENIKAYLYSIAYNKCLDSIKKRTRDKKKLRKYLEITEKQHLQAWSEAEITYGLLEHLQQLKNEHGDAARLYYCEGYSNKEIAGILKTSTNGVSQLKRYAVKKIKEILLKQKMIVVTSITVVCTHYSPEIFKKIEGLFSFFNRIVVFIRDNWNIW